jgi:proline iminopeptidase
MKANKEGLKVYIHINENTLYFEVYGKDDGEAILFIHGGPGLGDCRADVKAFSQLGDQYKLVFLDMRGSGRSEANPPFTHEQWTADIDGLRQQLNLDKIIIHGGSYGGFLSLEYVLRYPQNVTYVMLRDTSSNNNHHHLSITKALDSDLPGITKQMLERLFGGKVRSNEEFKKMFAAILPLYTVEYDVEQAHRQLDRIYYHYQTHNYAFHENMPKYNIAHRLKDIKVPVLVSVGRYDWVTPIVCSEEITTEIKQSTLHIFEKSGHSPHVEENDKYLQLVRDFLQKPSTQSESEAI